MPSELPPELEYVSDFQAQDNFRQSFRKQLDRALILMINNPDESFELALAGIDALLDHYKDETYLNDTDEIITDYNKRFNALSTDKRKGKNVNSQIIDSRFTYNLNRLRSLMRLAGRASFLPFPPVAIMAGGKNPEFKQDEILTSDETAEINKSVDNNLEKTNELAERSVDDLKNKKPEKEEIKDEPAPA